MPFEIPLPLTPPKSEFKTPSLSKLDFVSARIDSLSTDLRGISLKIHDNPELNYKEFVAHETLTSFLEAQYGWKVTRNLYGIDTAFVAIYDSERPGPGISFNAEYGNFQ